MENMISVLIADDHRLFRNGIMSLLTNVVDIQILEEANNGEELVRLYYNYNPDVVIADIAMPDISGFEAFKEIRKKDPRAKFIFLSMYDSPEYIHYAKKIGAKGLLGKNVRHDELVYAIRQAAKGEIYFGKEWTQEKLNELDHHFRNLADGKIDINIVLTTKEKEVLYYIGKGYSSSEIAEKLLVSRRTIDKHRENLIKKTDSESLSQLIAFAIKFNNIVDFKDEDFKN